MSVIGEKGNGKSFILDKILNLSGVRGNHLSVNKDKGIFIWSHPFRKRNIKVFLLDCEGFKSQGLSLIEAKIHTILMLLSSVILFNNKTKVHMDDAFAFQSLVKNTFTSAVFNNRELTKEDQVLARSLYHLHRSPSTASNHDLLKYFSEYNFTFLEDAMAPNFKGKDNDLVQCSFFTTSCISERYIRHIADIFESVMASIEQKTISGVTLNGNIVCKLLNHLAAMLNRESTLDINRLFKNIIQELYISAYNFCIITYSDILEKELRDEAPKSFDQILQILGRAEEETMTKYHEFNLDPQLHRLYLRKLQEHINMKEKLIIEINEKKTQNILRSEFGFEPATSTESALRNFQKFNYFRSELDHGRQEVAVEYYQKLLDGAVKNLGNYDLQRELEKNEGELHKLEEQIAVAKNRTKGLKEQSGKANQLKLRQQDKEKQLFARVETSRKKLDALMKEKITDSFNIEEVRNHFEPMVFQNQQKIGKMKSEIAALINQKAIPVDSKLDLTSYKKEFDELTKKSQEMKEIVGLQLEEIKALNEQIATKQKGQTKVK